MWTRTSSRRRAAWVAAVAAPAVACAQPDIEEVRVIGTPHDLSPAQMAQSITVLAGDRLVRSRSNTIGETLAEELGMSSTSFGSGASRPVIRGLAGARVKVMEDGVDSLDASSVSVDHAVGVDPIAAQQIEIFRGPTTLLYGSGAVGGVVNTVTNRIPSALPEDGFEAALEIRADSVARERTGAAAIDAGSDRFAWHVDASRRTADDYRIPGVAERGEDPRDPETEAGRMPNSDYETGSAAFGAAWLGERHGIGLSLRTFASDYGVPHHHHAEEHDDHDDHDDADHEHEPGTADAERVRIDLDATRLDLRADWLGLARFPGIELRLGVSDYEHLELENGEAATRFTNDAYEGRLEIEHAPIGEWTGAFGAQIGARTLAAVGHEAFLPEVDSRNAGAFVLEHRDFGSWRASLGARLESVRHEPVDRSAYSSSASSLSAAVIRRLPSDVSFAVNAALAERVPAAEELYSNGPHLASSTFEVGDPTLEVEASRHVDVGARRTDGRITWAVTAFRTEYDDFIYLAATGGEDEASGLPVFQHVQRNAELVGFEAELFAKVAEIGPGELDVRVHGDFVRARLAGGERLPRIPARRQGIRVQYHAERVVAGVEAVHHFDQHRVAPFETPSDAYTLLGFDVALKLGPEGRLDLLVKGSNLLDEEARRHTSIVKDLAPLPGRNFTVGLRATF